MNKNPWMSQATRHSPVVLQALQTDGSQGFRPGKWDDPTSNCANVSDENNLIVGIEIINHFFVFKSIMILNLKCD